MRKNSFFLFLLFFVSCYVLSIIPSSVFAQASSAKPTTPPTPSTAPRDVIEKLKQIESLKEKIATKVAEIREKDKTAVSGVVKKTAQTSLLITTRKGSEIHVSYSDDTIFYTATGSEKKEIRAKTIKENDFIAVFGYRDRESSTISSKYIYVQTPLSRIIGKIADVDKTNFTITVKDKEGSHLIDIESSTRMTLITPDKKKQKGGFSKFKIGDIIHVGGRSDKKDTEKLSASFITTLSNPNQGATLGVSPSITTQASPSATPKK